MSAKSERLIKNILGELEELREEFARIENGSMQKNVSSKSNIKANQGTDPIAEAQLRLRATRGKILNFSEEG